MRQAIEGEPCDCAARGCLLRKEIILPDDAGPELVALMRTCAAQKPYNPRAGMK